MNDAPAFPVPHPLPMSCDSPFGPVPVFSPGAAVRGAAALAREGTKLA